MPKNVLKKSVRRKVNITPTTVLFVADELGECTVDKLVSQLRSQLKLSEVGFHRACNYQFVPACVTPLLEKGWLLRKWDGKDYTFRITVTGKSELEKY